MSERGVLLSFEGGEGCGKSTQIARLARRLEAAKVPVLVLREPGGTAVGEAVRAILLDTSHAEMSPGAELLLYEAARAQLVAELIEPALDAGRVVILDRFYDSTTAYQGYGRGLPLAQVAELNAVATGGLRPDRTLLLDIEVCVGIKRATSRHADRIEAEATSFHERVREGFLSIARDEPERVLVVDADGSRAAVEGRIIAALRGLRVVGRAVGA